MMSAKERILQTFEELKGQFVITESRKIERLVAIGDDDFDYYWITYSGKDFTWNTCVGGLIKLKGKLDDKDYQKFIDSAKLNHADQDGFWGIKDYNGEEHKQEIVKLNGSDKFLTDIYWDLN